MGEQAADELRYTAFLSYSHKDAAAAGRLHRRLEAYRMPKRLVGLEAARGPVPERLAPIFRDREELPAATDLSETVRAALAQSGALIILCSPHAAGSLWVAEEIRVFRELHPDRPILAAVLDGDPPDCFPPALRAFGRDGTWHEPLATDLRPRRDGAHLGLLKLVAGITGVGLDALVQRDAARRVRRVTAVTIVALVALLVMAALALAAVDARREAESQRAEAEGLIEFMLTDLRERLKGDVGRLSVMTAVNRRALQFYRGQEELRGLDADSLDRRARILHAMGEDNYVRGAFPGALAAFREAHRITEEQLAREPDNNSRIFAHSQSEYWVGYVAYGRLDYPSARNAFERYKALADRLVARDPRNAGWLKEAGYAQGNLCAVALAERGDAARALASCSDALARMRRVHRLRPGDGNTVLDVANRHAFVADAWDRLNNWDRVLWHRHQEQALIRSLIEREPDNLNYLDFWMKCQHTFADILVRHGQPQEARRWFEGAAAVARRLHAHDPENTEWRDWARRTAASLAANRQIDARRPQ